MLAVQKLTYNRNPRIDNLLKEEVKSVLDLIVDDFDPEAVIADGSLGKGEISAIEKKGKLIIFSDFDLQVVMKSRIKPYTMLSYSDKISKIFGFEINVRMTSSDIFNKSHHKDPKYDFEFPSISTYDRKYGSKVIYGNDFIGMIPEIDGTNIPVWEGIRIVLNRLGEFCGKVNSSYLDHNRDGKINLLNADYQDYCYSKNKCVLACMDAILIFNNVFHWSLKKKLENLIELFENTKGKKSTSTKIQSLISRAVDIKLSGEQSNDLIGDREMVNLVISTLNYILKKELDFKSNDWLRFPSKWVKSSKVNNEYYRGPTSSLTYQNGIVLAKFFLLRKFTPSIRLFLHLHIFWSHIMYSNLPLLLLAICPRKNKSNSLKNPNYLRVVRHNFSKIATLENPSSDYWKEWDYLTDLGNKIWFTSFLI